MALMQLTVIPLGTGSASLGAYVAQIQRALEQQTMPYQLTDMGTVVEGEPGALLALAAQLHEIPFGPGVNRVVTQIVLDDRRDKKIALGDKIASVRQRLGVVGG